MPRLVFEDIGDLKEWVEQHCTFERHEIYVTKNKEVIVAPLKTTKPITYAYYKAKNGGDELTKEFLHLEIRIHYLKSFEWDIEKKV